MVDVKEPFVLCEKHGSRACASVEPGRNDTEVICSFEDGHVGIYDVSRTSCVHA